MSAAAAYTLSCASAQAMEACGAALADAAAGGPLTLYLQGDLGAGKSTLARGFIRRRGVTGAIKSPTFTVVEPYEIAPHPIYHFDLYRLASAAELHAIGIDEYFDGRGTCLVEWPEHGSGCLPVPDIELRIAIDGSGRRVSMAAHSEPGRVALAAVAQAAASVPELVLSGDQ